MSVILNIDMPESCNKCPLNDGVHCYITGKDWNWGMSKRRSDCPLKSVDGLIEKIENRRYTNKFHFEQNANSTGLASAIEIIQEYCEMEDENAE